MGKLDYTYRLKAESGDSTPHDELAVSGAITGGTITLVDLGSGDWAWQIAGLSGVAVPSKTVLESTAGSGVTVAVRMAVTTYPADYVRLFKWSPDPSGGTANGDVYLAQEGANVIRAGVTGPTTCFCPTATVGTVVRTYVLRERIASGTDYADVWRDMVGRVGSSADGVSPGQYLTTATLDELLIGSVGSVVKVSDIVLWGEELSDADCAAIADNIDAALAAGDTTPPVLTTPTGTQTGSTTANVGATTDEGNGTMYAVATTSVTQPSVAQIKASQDHTGAAAAWGGSQAISTTGAKTLGATGLTASTGYYAHVMHADAAANDSNRVSSSLFTTASASMTITTQPLRNGAGTLLASTNISKIAAVKLSDMSVVKTWADQVTDGSGVLALSDVALTAVAHLLLTSSSDGSAAGVKVYTPA